MGGNRRNVAIVAVLALLAALLGFNLLSSVVVRGVRVDLTEGRIYSLSPGAKALLARLDEPVRMELYWSEESGRDLPQFRAYADRVREFLEELVGASRGKLSLRRLDPQPWSEAEDAARTNGLAQLRVDESGRMLTLGLVIVNAVDEREVLPFLDPTRESFLEYEVIRSIHAVSRAKPPTVGLISRINMDAQIDPRNPRQVVPAWHILSELRSMYGIEFIPPESEALPDGIDVLLIVHPRALPEPLLRDIDRWALAGRPLMICMDPWCDADPVDAGGGGSMGGFQSGSASDLGPLLDAWGIAWSRQEVIGDRGQAQRVRTQGQGGPAVLDFVLWLAVEPARMAEGDPITGALKQVNLATPGFFRPAAGAPAGSSVTLEPLMRTSEDAKRYGTDGLMFMMDPAALLRDFTSDGRSEWLAVRATGAVRSAYAEGMVDGGTPATGTINAILVGDVDFLHEQYWAQEERLGPISLGWRTYADNGAFVLNALEVLAGDEALSGLRGRQRYTRPFDRVRDLRREAERVYLDREQQLQTEIRETEQRIQQLQRDRGTDASFTLTPEQMQEIDRLQERMVSARRELRQVQHGLRKDIEALGTRLMVMNVILWPLIVAVLAAAWSIRRTLRQRRRTGGSPA